MCRKSEKRKSPMKDNIEDDNLVDLLRIPDQKLPVHVSGGLFIGKKTLIFCIIIYNIKRSGKRRRSCGRFL